MKNRTRLAAAFLLVTGMLAAGLPAFARGSVSGKVVDGAGKGVRDLTVRFVHDDGDATTVITKKGGKFFGRMSGGQYAIDLVDSELFILSLEYVAKDDAGLVIGEGQLAGDPRSGVSGVLVSDLKEIQLTLTVADKGSDVARQRTLAFAMDELSAAANFYNAGKYEEAAAEALELIEERPELGEGYYTYGVSLDQLGRYAEADSALTRTVELIPDHPGIWGVIGEVRMKLAVELEDAGVAEADVQFARAGEALTKALESQPDSLPLQLNLAGCLDRAGDTARLVPLLEQIVEQDPSQLQWRLRLASLRSQQGDPSAAMALLREIPAGEKQAAITLFNIAVRADESGDIDGALLLAQRAAEIDPSLPNPKQLVAQLLLAKGEMTAAKDAIRAFLEVAPDGPDKDTYTAILAQLEAQ